MCSPHNKDKLQYQDHYFSGLLDYYSGTMCEDLLHTIPTKDGTEASRGKRLQETSIIIVTELISDSVYQNCASKNKPTCPSDPDSVAKT